MSATRAMTGYLYDGVPVDRSSSTGRDADGNRVAKGTIGSWSCDTTTNGFSPTTTYILGPGNQQLTELTWSDNTPYWAHTNVWAAGQLMATYSSPNPGEDVPGVLDFQFGDWLGTRRVLTDYTGNVEEQCHSLPYGNGEDCAPTPTEHLFTQHERDAETNNDYFGARYYASSVGRFMSPDWSAKIEPVPYSKLDNPQSLNLYAYVLNNPLTLRDADGHACADPKKGCPITVQFRAFIPQKSMDGFKGDNRSFSNDPNASSRVVTTATINTNSSANGGNPLVSSSSKVQSTTLLPGVDGGVTRTASGPEMPQVTASQDKNGNVTLHLTENVRNPFQPGGNGIAGSVNIMIPQSGASASVSGSLSGSPSFELNVSSQTGPTANIPVAGSSSSPVMFPINLETQRPVNVTGQVP